MTTLIGTKVVRIVKKEEPHKKVLLRKQTGSIYISFSEAQLNLAPTSGYSLPIQNITIEYPGDIFAVADAADRELEILIVPDIGKIE